MSKSYSILATIMALLFATTVKSSPNNANYSPRGCYTEPSTGRALAGDHTRSDTMTTNECASFCETKGYSMFGLEFHNECYCGNSLAAGAVEASVAQCNFKCIGDQSEPCGGNWRFNLYQLDESTLISSTSDYTSEGCYTDDVTYRALSDHVYYDEAMTVEKCAASCASYTWFGLEFRQECYCGKTIRSSGQPTGLSECSFPCPGNNAQKCGAGRRLNVYRHTAVEPSTTTIAISSSTTTVHSKSAPIPSSVAASELSTSTTTPQSTTVLPTTTSAESSTTAATICSPMPIPISVITDGNSTAPGGGRIQIYRPGLITSKFASENGPQGGLASGSITYASGANTVDPRSSQPNTPEPNALLNFSGYTRAGLPSGVESGYNVYFVTGDTTDSSPWLKIMNPDSNSA